MAVHPMSLVDHAWLRMDSPQNLLVVNSVIWTDEPVDPTVMRALLAERMVGQFPRFRQRPDAPHLPFGRAHWIDDESFDLDRHVLQVALEEPGDTAALQRYVGTQTATPLDPAYPLWQTHIISGYGTGSAVLFRVHHAIADGMALARMLMSFTDDSPDVGFAAPKEPRASTGWRGRIGGLVHDGYETVVHPRRLLSLGTTAARDAARLAYIADLPVKPRSVLNSAVGVPKLVTWSQPMALDRIKEIGRESGSTVNDVLLAALGGAFRTYLLERGEDPGNVPVLIPVDLRPPTAPLPREMGNDFGFFFLNLLAGIADPRERLAAVKRQTHDLKHSPEALVTVGVLAGMGASPGIIEDFSVAFFVSKVSGVVTNVPGPRHLVYLAGTRVAGVIGWVPRGGDLSFGVAIFSYAGTVTVGVSTDATAIPDPEAIVAAFETELEVLAGQPV